MVDKARIRRILIYAAKCVTGVLVVLGLSRLVNYNDIIWVLISVMLVLSPDGSDAVTLAVTRIKANVVGGVSGFLLILVHPNMFLMMCTAVFGDRSSEARPGRRVSVHRFSSELQDTFGVTRSDA